MADQLEDLRSREKFLSLATRAGLEISEADLAQLIRRNLLQPWQGAHDGAESYHLLHLYLLVRYFDAVRPIRHPWSTVAPELTLQDIIQEAAGYREIIEQLVGDEKGAERERLDELARAIGRRAESINPFGALSEAARLLGDEGRVRLRGDGLLYVCLVELAEQLEAAAEVVELGVEAEAEVDEEPQTEAEVDESSAEVGEVEGEVEGELDEESEPIFLEDEAIVTQTLEIDEDVVGEEPPNAFSRQNSEVTARTQDLQSRLDQLRNRDKEIARKRANTPPKNTEAQAAAPKEAAARPENLSERIAELNRLRETYLAEQRWEDLAELYEDGIELFVDAAERQQVFLTLAMLYEVKLEQLEPAFEKFVAAFLEEGTQKAQRKAFEGLERLGRQASIQARYVDFLEERLGEGSLDKERRAALRRLLALALHNTGQIQRAFFTYTAFLAEAEPAQVDERALDELEELAAGVDSEELGDFYADLFSHELPDEVFEPMATRAARHHADRGEVGLAMEYYERVLGRLPDHEVAFHSLAQLYEDSGRYSRLVELYEVKIERLGEDASAAPRSELERIRELAQAATTAD